MTYQSPKALPCVPLTPGRHPLSHLPFTCSPLSPLSLLSSPHHRTRVTSTSHFAFNASPVPSASRWVIGPRNSKCTCVYVSVYVYVCVLLFFLPFFLSSSSAHFICDSGPASSLQSRRPPPLVTNCLVTTLLRSSRFVPMYTTGVPNPCVTSPPIG